MFKPSLYNCFFKNVLQVLVATTDVMEWIETVLMEVNGTKQSPFDIEYSKVNLDLDYMKITTTTRTTDLVKVSDFRN